MGHVRLPSDKTDDFEGKKPYDNTKIKVLVQLDGLTTKQILALHIFNVIIWEDKR